MLIVTLAATLVAAPAVGIPMTDQKALRSVAPVCQDVAARPAGKAGGPLVRPLGKEPPADRIASVLYTEGQCSKPVVISRGIGMKPAGK